MEKLHIFGHTNPDTDSICASITLANLKREMGLLAEEYTLGLINKETKFVLNYWGFKEPKYLNDIKLKIKDTKYRKKCYLDENTSIEKVYNYMLKENTTGVPIIDKNKKLINLITAKDILRKMISIENHYLETSYENIIDTLKGEKIVKCTEEIKGNILAAAFNHSTFESTVNLTENDIVIVGDRHYIIDLSIRSKVELLIIIGGTEIKKEHIELAKKNKVNIIRTKLNTFETSRLIMYSNYIKKILNKEFPQVIYETDYFDDFISNTSSLKIDNYPVIDKRGFCKGLLRKSEINKLNKKKVILVDHNETEQSVIGLEEAEIMEIIDHHKIGKLSTTAPINFRNMTVGSTNTIIYFLYKENGIKINKKIAGLLLSGIISDTLYFISPTSTEIDKQVVNELNKILKLNIKDYAFKMFSAGTSLEGLTINDILNTDTKTFKKGDIKFTVSQTFTMDYMEIINKKEEYLKEIENEKNRLNTDYYVFIITDIIKNGSYIMYSKNSEELVKKAWNNRSITNGYFIEKCVSRKKQIVPIIIDALEN